MKKLLRSIVALALVYSLSSCDKDDKELGFMKFHWFSWDIDTIPLTIPSSAFDHAFYLQDAEGYSSGIHGVPHAFFGTEQNMESIKNTFLKPVIDPETGFQNYINSVKSDTIRGTWFTVINEEKKQLRVILDKNEGTETRVLGMYVWASGNPDVYKGHPECNRIVIHQQPSKNQ